MIAGLLLAPAVALTIWAVANHYGYSVTYVETIVYVLVAKVTAMYLKNDVSVELNVVKSESKSEGESE